MSVAREPVRNWNWVITKTKRQLANIESVHVVRGICASGVSSFGMGSFRLKDGRVFRPELAGVYRKVDSHVSIPQVPHDSERYGAFASVSVPQTIAWGSNQTGHMFFAQRRMANGYEVVRLVVVDGVIKSQNKLFSLAVPAATLEQFVHLDGAPPTVSVLVFHEGSAIGLLVHQLPSETR